MYASTIRNDDNDNEYIYFVNAEKIQIFVKHNDIKQVGIVRCMYMYKLPST